MALVPVARAGDRRGMDSPTAAPSALSRTWRWLTARGNPLARESDRTEALVVVVCALLALLAIPAAAAVGSAAHADQVQLSEHQRATRQHVGGVLTDDVPLPIHGGANQVSAPARWHAGGVEHTGTVHVRAGLPEGTRVTVWLDERGRPVPAPLSNVEVRRYAIGLALFTWAIAALVLTAAVAGTRVVLDRTRARRWDEEWRQFCGVEPAHTDDTDRGELS